MKCKRMVESLTENVRTRWSFTETEGKVTLELGEICENGFN
ncbi:26044_t:CDS:2 [Racocetra persica]|uniref:26044_t:CDS:1 n=1 Tax=Racocetra persica TaxID=160502 RepID=A0ACA9KBQ4_9GLOM|nr:26044_t:CDS:2 [Racocetra persica]